MTTIGTHQVDGLAGALLGPLQGNWVMVLGLVLGSLALLLVKVCEFHLDTCLKGLV